MSLVKRTGRIGTYSDAEADQIKSSILDVLKQVGIQESEFPEVLNDWYKFTEFDYASVILDKANLPSCSSGEMPNELDAWRSCGIERKTPTPAQLESFLQKCGIMTLGLEEWLKDYEYYVKARTHRRPDVWKQRETLRELKEE